MFFGKNKKTAWGQTILDFTKTAIVTFPGIDTKVTTFKIFSALK